MITQQLVNRFIVNIPNVNKNADGSRGRDLWEVEGGLDGGVSMDWCEDHQW